MGFNSGFKGLSTETLGYQGGTGTRLCVGQPRNRCSLSGRKKELPIFHRVYTGCALRTVSLAVKWPGRKADDSLTPPRDELKNEWSFTANPPYALMKCAGPNLYITESHKYYIRAGCGQYNCNLIQIMFI